MLPDLIWLTAALILAKNGKVIKYRYHLAKQKYQLHELLKSDLCHETETSSTRHRNFSFGDVWLLETLFVYMMLNDQSIQLFYQYRDYLSFLSFFSFFSFFFFWELKSGINQIFLLASRLILPRGATAALRSWRRKSSRFLIFIRKLLLVYRVRDNSQTIWLLQNLWHTFPWGCVLEIPAKLR